MAFIQMISTYFPVYPVNRNPWIDICLKHIETPDGDAVSVVRCCEKTSCMRHADRMKQHVFAVFVGLHIFSMISCGKSETSAPKEATVQIFAAAGTRLATDEICNRYEQEGHGRVLRNFASSGTLARQIASGAEADVFVSANRQWMDFLKNKRLLAEGSVQEIAGNELVIVAPKGAAPIVPAFKKNFNINASIKDKIAVGDPAYVPVGKYTKSAFDHLGWYDQIQDKIVEAKDVSSVLNYVALGEVDWGVVYRSEAMASDRVEIIARVPGTLHDPIEFFVADLGNQKTAARALSKMFRSKAGRAVFVKFGFLALR
jgi:molybdate transport system substrate-binding protein